MAFGEVQDYTKHIVFAVLWVVVFLWLNLKYDLFGLPDWKSMVLFIPVILFYAGLPDLDHQSAKPRFVFTVLILLSLLYCLVVGVWWGGTTHLYLAIGLVLVLLAVWTIKFLPGWGHRGHSHSVVFVSLASLPLVLWDWRLAVLAWIASLSHLLFDMELKLW